MGIVADLASALDLERLDPGRYRGNSVDSPERDVVFGGQLVAQLAVAAARGEPGKRVKTVHALFARVASKAKPIDFDVEPLHSGRTMASATVTASQDGRLRARANVLLTADDEDLIRHAARMPDVEPPEALESLTDSYVGRELRVTGGADLNGADLNGTTAAGDTADATELAVWTRMPGASGEPAVLQGLLAHATAGFLIGAAMRPHPGLTIADAHDKFSTGILGHSVTFHEDVDPSDWILLAHESPYAGRGRSYGRGHAFARDGRLVASFAQDAIIRRFASPSGTRDGGRDKASVL